MRKSMQNGTQTKSPAAEAVAPLVVLSRHTLYLFLRLIYQPPTKPSKRPVGTATRMRGRIYGLPLLPPTSDFVIIYDCDYAFVCLVLWCRGIVDLGLCVRGSDCYFVVSCLGF